VEGIKLVVLITSQITIPIEPESCFLVMMAVAELVAKPAELLRPPSHPSFA
jgi:hypothetical protein